MLQITARYKYEPRCALTLWSIFPDQDFTMLAAARAACTVLCFCSLISASQRLNDVSTSTDAAVIDSAE